MASSTSSSSSSSSSSSTSSSTSTHEVSTHNNLTIGLAVGLGVGIPILLTILVLIWVTIRHRRKLREEDEEDRDIDFNGDVSFWSPTGVDHGKFGNFDTSLGGVGGGGARRADTMTTHHDGESTTNLSEVDAMSQSEHGGNPSLSQMYTPELGFVQGSRENFSRAIHSVYGPSPAYPSSEKLRAPSFGGSSLRHQYYAPSISSSHLGTPSHHGGAGPFATPPRNYNPSVYSTASQLPVGQSFSQSTHPYADHYRRSSDGSVQQLQSQQQGQHPLPPHPKQNYVENVDGAGFSETSDGTTSLESSSGGSDFPHSRGTTSAAPAPGLNASLGQLRESPHPYSNLAGNRSAQSLHTASSRAYLVPDTSADGVDDDIDDNVSDPASPLRGDRKRGTHIYRQQARDRNSTFGGEL